MKQPIRIQAMLNGRILQMWHFCHTEVIARQFRIMKKLLLLLQVLLLQALISCTSQERDYNLHARFVFTDINRPYFYYQVSLSRDTISYFSPSRGYTEKILTTSEQDKLIDAFSSLPKDILYVDKMPSPFILDECTEKEYKYNSMSLSINDTDILYVTDCWSKRIPTEYKRCIDRLINSSDFLGIRPQVSDRSALNYEDLIFEYCPFIFYDDDSTVKAKVFNNKSSKLKIPSIKLELSYEVDEDLKRVLTIQTLGDSIETTINYNYDDVIRHEKDVFYQLFAPYEGTWEELASSQEISLRLTNIQAKELMTLANNVCHTKQYIYTPTKNALRMDGTILSCSLMIDNQEVFNTYDCHFDNAPLEMIKMYMCILKSSGLATDLSKIKKHKSR